MYNDRLVSILPNLPKVLEKSIYNQIVDYFEGILSQYQCGFRKRHSAQHCLLVLLEKICNFVDQVLKLGTFFTDLSKAFDSLSTQCNSW